MRRYKWLFGLALTTLMMVNPLAAAQGAAQAMFHWYASVVPALFPFLALMPLLTSREACLAYERMLGGVMEKVFKLPGAAASAMIVGIVSGAPAGAIAARNVAARSGMNQGQLNRLSVAASGFSPAFLVGGIGVGMLGSAAMGWRLLEAQLLTQLTLGLILRCAWRDRDRPAPKMPGLAEEHAMRGAVMALLTICGYMALFGALTRVLGTYVGQNPSNIILCLLDVPSGARLVAEMKGIEELRLPVLSAMCGFGGICVIAQCLGSMKGCGVSAAEFMSMRVLAGLISAGYMMLLTRVSGGGMDGWVKAVQGKPLETAALVAAALAVPAIVGMKKQHLNIAKNQTF